MIPLTTRLFSHWSIPLNGLLRQVFIRVYRLEICRQSRWYFRPSFVNCCHSPPLSGSSPPSHPPCVNKYAVYKYTVQCVRGRVWGSWPQTNKHLPQSPITGQFFQMTTFCIAFYGSYLSTKTHFHLRASTECIQKLISKQTSNICQIFVGAQILSRNLLNIFLKCSIKDIFFYIHGVFHVSTSNPCEKT